MISESEKEELIKLQEFRKKVWKIAWECSSDWMVIRLNEIEKRLKIVNDNDDDEDNK